MREKKYLDGFLINFSSSNGYPTIYLDGKNVLVHRYVWQKHYGIIPKGFVVHHKDENKLNWNIENLELKKNREHSKEHAVKNQLGKSNKGKKKVYQSGCVKIAHPVKLKKGKEEIIFDSEMEAIRFLHLKSVSSITNVLSGRSKTAKGWEVESLA